VAPVRDWLVGGYGPDSGGTAAGISLARPRSDGVLEVVGLAVALESPSWITVHGDHVYTALEAAGQVASLRRTEDGLELDGVAPAGGSFTCALAVSAGRLVAANYGDGVVGVIGLDDAGAVTGLIQALPNSGSGPHPDQGNARAHAVFTTDDGAVITLDLGADQALVHRWRGDELVRLGEYRFPAGTGPRDIARHPSGRLVVLGELDGSTHLFDWADDRLIPVASAGLDGFEPRAHAASIAFSADGRFGYSSLRGPGRIARVEFRADGLLAVGSVSAEGPWVRHLAVDGDLLHAANEKTTELTTFRVGADGDLAVVGATPAPSPTFLAPLLEY
jgi:6-phosphogluconolactonase